MEFDRRDVTVGAFVAGSLAVFLLVLLALNRHRLVADTYHLNIELPNITGIDKGIEVIYQGYRAGTVDKITVAYEPQFRFIVRLAIKTEIKLRAGTLCVVRSKGLGASKYLELSPPESDARWTLAELQDGALLPTIRDADMMTKAHDVMGELQRIFNNFQKKGTAEDLAVIVKRMDSVLLNMDKALINFNILLEENRTSVKGLTARSSDLLDRKDGDLGRSLVHLPAIMTNLEEFVIEIRRNPWRLVRKGEPGGPPLKVDHAHERPPAKPAPAP